MSRLPVSHIIAWLLVALIAATAVAQRDTTDVIPDTSGGFANTYLLHLVRSDKPTPSTVRTVPDFAVVDPIAVASVGPSGQSLVVMAYGQSGDSEGESIRILQREPRTGSWRHIAIRRLPTPAEGIELHQHSATTPSGFGRSLAFTKVNNKDYLIVCAPLFKVNDPQYPDASGACFFYEHSTSGSLVLRPEMTIYAPGLVKGDASIAIAAKFGTSIAVVGDKLVIGAPETSVGGVAKRGAAFMYTYSSGTLKYDGRQSILNPSGQPGEMFGFSVALSPGGQYVAVGAPLCTIQVGSVPFTQAGRAYVYSWNSNNPTQLVNQDPRNQAHYGYSLTFLSDSHLVVGAPGWSADIAPNSDGRGALRRFMLSGNQWQDGGLNFVNGDNTNGKVQFGTALAYLGENDNFLVTAPGDNKAYVIKNIIDASITEQLEVDEIHNDDHSPWQSVGVRRISSNLLMIATTGEKSVWIAFYKCPSLHYDHQCIPCSNGCNITCESGPTANGTCYDDCKSDWKSKQDGYGRCDLLCPDRCAACSADNLCTACMPRRYGDGCGYECPAKCNDGFCFEGPNGNGTCAVGGCQLDFYGPQCMACPSGCASGQCNDGSSGRPNDGTCIQCKNHSKYGPTCELDCPSKCDHIVADFDMPVCDIETGKCTQCAPNHWGENCDPCPAGCDVAAAQGEWTCNPTTGVCYGCPTNFFGWNCTGRCPKCGPAGCKDGPEGDGLCINCEPNTWGPRCEDCKCDGDCNDGVDGDGGCKDCFRNYYKVDDSCIPCPEGCNITCYDIATPDPYNTSFIPNNGTCIVCLLERRYGEYCQNECSPTCKTCFEGPWANGSCSSCIDDHYGPLCLPCADNCTDGCDDGLHGSGKCNGCPDDRYGFFCENECPETCATCFYGPDANGTCITCPANMWGEECKYSCTNCADQGVAGNNCWNDPLGINNGSCIQCAPDRGGWNCELQCPSGCNSSTDGGECDSGVGRPATCTKCPDGYWGEECDQRCFCKDNQPCERLTGLCPACEDNNAGPTCNLTCPPGCNMSDPFLVTYGAKCNNGPDGDGTCISCTMGNYGPDCSGICQCSSNTDCDANVTGTGACIACLQGRYGERCEFTCDERCSSCFDQPDGNGTCIGCEVTFYGPNCEFEANCPAGDVCTGCGSQDGNGACEGPDCPSGFYGYDCKSNCSDVCKTGCADATVDEPQCETCDDGRWGPSCDLCQCFNGVCDQSTGKCASCNPGYAGELCNIQCISSDLCDDCNDGVSGNGKCSQCKDGYYGPDCDQCPPGCRSNGGKCDNTGQCTVCSPGRYGPNCAQLCSAECDGCNAGSPSDNGHCIQCKNPGRYGDFCEYQCSPNCLTCDEGPTGSGVCLSCPPGKYGPNCDQSCPSRCTDNCDDGPSGTGECKECPKYFYGEDCTGRCTIACNECNDGMTGNGTCNGCALGVWGLYCNQTCPSNCRNGCDQLTGKCNRCPDNRYGEDCNNLCPSTCNRAGECFNGPDGNGTCAKCPSGRFGADCSGFCPTGCPASGLCDDGVAGTGSCLTCAPGRYGPACSQVCPIECRGPGECFDGPAGNGTCITQPPTPEPTASPDSSPSPSPTPTADTTPTPTGTPSTVSSGILVELSVAVLFIVLLSFM